MNSVAVADVDLIQGFGVDAGNCGFLLALEGVVSKLDLFVQIVDKASKVCILFNAIQNSFQRNEFRFTHMSAWLGR